MKKILSLVFAFTLIFSCFAVTAFAEDMEIVPQPVITFSEDYQKLYADNEPFSRIDASMLNLEFDNKDMYIFQYEYNTDYESSHTVSSDFIQLSEAQKENIKDVYIEQNEQKNIYRVEFTFNDGSVLTVVFLKDTYLEEYNSIISGEGEANEYIINFVYPDGNVVTAKKSDLFGEPVDLTKSDFYYYDVSSVNAVNSDGSLAVTKGELLIIDDMYVYVDYAESGIDASFYYDEADDDQLSKCVFHKITDEQLISDFQKAEQAYYEDDFGFLYDNEVTDAVSEVFLIFVFGIVPAIIFVILLIKAIRGKGVYKKLYGAVAAVSAAELAVFTVITVIIANLN